MKLSLLLAVGATMASVLCFAPNTDAQEKAAKPVKPLKALLVLGGCCHDYKLQQTILKAGLEERLNLVVDVEYTPDKGTTAKFPAYEKKDWAAGYDVIIHDECSADVTDKDYVKRILDAHANGVPAVNLHCAMHSYRWGNYRDAVAAGADNAGWYEMLGLQSTGHGPQLPIDIDLDDTHPINKGLADWTTGKEELYNNVSVLGGKAIAKGKQVTKNKEGQEKITETIVAWTNEYGPKKTRIFSTTIGHNNETVSDDRYLNLISRGILWATSKMSDDGTPAEGYSVAAKK